MTTRGTRSAEYQPAGYQSDLEARRYADAEPSPGAVFGTVLAGILMIVSGVFGFLSGLAMVLKRSFFVTSSGYAYNWPVRDWGWTELIIGAVVFLAGVCVLLGMTWARVVGVIVAVASAIGSFMVLPYYPVWSIVLIAVDIFIIWALVSYRRPRHA